MAIKATRDGHIKLPTKVASPPFWRGRGEGLVGEGIGQG